VEALVATDDRVDRAHARDHRGIDRRAGQRREPGTRSQQRCQWIEQLVGDGLTQLLPAIGTTRLVCCSLLRLGHREAGGSGAQTLQYRVHIKRVPRHRVAR